MAILADLAQIERERGNLDAARSRDARGALTPDDRDDVAPRGVPDRGGPRARRSRVLSPAAGDSQTCRT